MRTPFLLRWFYVLRAQRLVAAVHYYRLLRVRHAYMPRRRRAARFTAHAALRTLRRAHTVPSSAAHARTATRLPRTLSLLLCYFCMPPHRFRTLHAYYAAAFYAHTLPACHAHAHACAVRLAAAATHLVYSLLLPVYTRLCWFYCSCYCLRLPATAVYLPCHHAATYFYCAAFCPAPLLLRRAATHARRAAAARFFMARCWFMRTAARTCRCALLHALPACRARARTPAYARTLWQHLHAARTLFAFAHARARAHAAATRAPLPATTRTALYRATYLLLLLCLFAVGFTLRSLGRAHAAGCRTPFAPLRFAARVCWFVLHACTARCAARALP